jgi:hypothetical protein
MKTIFEMWELHIHRSVWPPETGMRQVSNDKVHLVLTSQLNTFPYTRLVPHNDSHNICEVGLILLYNGYRGSFFPGLKCGRGVTLTTHHHLIPRSGMNRSYISSPLSDSVACSGTALARCNISHVQRYRLKF